MPKISALPPAGSLADDDETPFVDDSASQTKKFTLSGLLVWLQSKTAWITNAMITNNTVTADKINWTTSGEIWWEELGRTVLGSNGDTLSIQGLEAKKHVRLLISVVNSGGLNLILRLNNDSGNNYAQTLSVGYASGVTATSQSSLNGWINGSNSGFIVVDIINIAANAKALLFRETGMDAGAGTAPFSVTLNGKWSNTSDQITRVDVLNTGAGDIAAGSEIVVLGHN